MGTAVRCRAPPLPTLKDILRLYEISARKQLAQNFILDMNISRKIIRCAGSLQAAHVCEVGPGPGPLTRAILEQDVKELTVVEKDGRFLHGLEMLSEAYPNKMKIVHKDILRYDMDDLWTDMDAASDSWFQGLPNAHLIGNLPFNVSTPLIFKWLEAISNRTGPFRVGRTQMTLTFQKEVAERFVAPIDGEQRCRVSVMAQYLTKPKIKFLIPGSAFVPKPEVDAGVVHFEPLEEPLIFANFKVVEKFCRHLFHFRRKYSFKGVVTLYPEEMRPELADEVFRRARVDRRVQCMKISVEELADMVAVYEEQCRRIPGLLLYDYRNRKMHDLQELAARPDALPPPFPFPNDLLQTETLSSPVIKF